MRTALNIPALFDFQSGLRRAMECRPPRFDREFAAIEREANKLRGWLGSRGSERPPQNASRAALREFVRLRDLPTLRHATLASFGCIDPFGDWKQGLISDAELFPMFLDRVDSTANNNAFIMCIGEHVVVEFGLKGNACFIFKRDRLPFRCSGRSPATT
jgi:hypothetical protein